MSNCPRLFLCASPGLSTNYYANVHNERDSTLPSSHGKILPSASDLRHLTAHNWQK